MKVTMGLFLGAKLKMPESKASRDVWREAAFFYVFKRKRKRDGHGDYKYKQRL